VNFYFNKKKTKRFVLGSQTLRDFSFNETLSGSFIDTIHESCLGQIDESTNNDEIDNDNELIHTAIEDLNDDPSHTNEIFKNALNELSNQDPSIMHSNIEHYQSQQSTNVNIFKIKKLILFV
jgi:spermidine/putrescine-binding protein